MNVIVFSLEPLRPQKRVDEVNHDEHGDNQTEKIIQCHRRLLKPIAAEHVEPREEKKQDGNADENEICHFVLRTSLETYSAQARCQGGKAIFPEVAEPRGDGLTCQQSPGNQQEY